MMLLQELTNYDYLLGIILFIIIITQFQIFIVIEENNKYYNLTHYIIRVNWQEFYYIYVWFD